jgi:hypothetical protein
MFVFSDAIACIQVIVLAAGVCQQVGAVLHHSAMCMLFLVFTLPVG